MEMPCLCAKLLVYPHFSRRPRNFNLKVYLTSGLEKLGLTLCVVPSAGLDPAVVL